MPASGLQGDVAGGGLRIALRAGTCQHVRARGVDKPEDTVDVGGDGAAPLGGGHFGHGGGRGRPDAVIGDEDVEIAEGHERRGDEGFAVLGRKQLLANWEA